MSDFKIPFFGKRTSAALAAVIFLLGFLIFLPSLGAPFLHDDDIFILKNNPAVFSLSGLKQLFSPEYFKVFKETTYHPAVNFSYVVAGNLFGTNPFGFHLFNLILHCLCSLLVIRCGALLSGNIWPGIAAGMLFLLHPVHVEPVIVASFNEDIIAAFFSLLAIWTVLKQEDGGVNRLFIPVFYGLALLSKESAVFLPLIFIAAVPFKKIQKTLGACSIVLLLYCALRVFVSRGGEELFPDFSSISINPLPLLSLYSIMWFFPGKLSPVYTQPGGITVMAGVAFLLISCFAAVYRAGGKKALAVSAACFIAGLAMYLNLIPLREIAAYLRENYAADRYLYLPSAGLAWISVSAAGFFLPKIRLQRAGAILTVTVAAALAALTIYQQTLWAGGTGIWERALKTAPQNARANRTLGTLLGNNDPERALFLLRRGLGSGDIQATARGQTKLGRAYLLQGNSKKAVCWFSSALRLAPDNTYAWNGLAAALAAAGDLRGAEAAYKKGLALAPDSVTLRENLEKVRRLSGDKLRSAQE